MKIKERETSQLKLKWLDLITKNFVELGQVKDDKNLAILAQTVATDILEESPKVPFEEIQQS